MRTSSITLLALLCCFNATQLSARAQQPLTLDAIFAGSEFHNKTLRDIQWSGDEKTFTYLKENSDNGLSDIYQYTVASGRSRPFLRASQLKHDGRAIQISHHRWAGGRNIALLRGPVKLTWDGRLEAPHFIYQRPEKKLWPLADGNPHLRKAKLSPDGKRVGYVLENDLYITELADGSTRAVTSDGSADIFNGFFDYGSTEFFGVDEDAWYWSPDSRKIAFWRLDTSAVKVFHMVDQLGDYPQVRPMKYPNAGEAHAVNQIVVYDLDSDKKTFMDIGDNPDDYIPLISWTPSSAALAIQRLTRDHEKLQLLFADIRSGQSRVIVTDTDPAWIDITRDLRFLSNTRQFVWTSEKSGYRHAYLYDYDGRETALTSGDWEITALIGLDEREQWLYFTAKKDTFIDQHIYRVALSGSEVERLSDRPGWYQWQFSPSRRHIVETYSDARTPPRITLREPGGRQIRVLEANHLPAMEKYAMPHTEFMKIKTGDGISIDAFVIKPLDFDPKKRYPAIGYGYGNAGSQVVVNRWGTQRGPRQDLWHRYMAQQGYIVFAFDNRTTAGRGKAAKNLTYGHYAKYALHDYLEGVKHLKTLPYIDPDRLGFWGWSGGGYLAAALMTKGAAHISTAVSVAPVIDLSRYQAVGVERWMDFIDHNPKGYYETNLINYADKLQGNLLLIHGSGDENVKYAFTLQFADALIKHNKQFDMMIYPNQHHGIRDYQQHVFTKISNYFFEKL